MYIPWNWLEKHLIFPQNFQPPTIAKNLTAGGLETEIVGENWQFTPLPNRLDLFSWWGIAQEISILLNYPLNLPLLNPPRDCLGQAINWGQVKMKTNECSQIQLVLMQNIKVQDSPNWIKKYLISNHITAINNMVDLANLVMLETGQPLHIYDYDQLSSREIVVRKALNGENMTNLKGQAMKLSDRDLVISAGAEIISLAGIIGSKTTAVSGKTTNILIESASFAPAFIKKTNQHLNFSTPASQYFSKSYNLPWGNYALPRVVELIKEFCPQVGESKILGTKEPTPEKKTILLSHEFIEKKLGIKLSSEEVEEILQKMQFSFEKR